MRYRSTRTAGRHRAPETETLDPATAGPAPRRPRGNADETGPATRRGRRQAARIAAAQARADRKHHLIAAASVASLGLISSFMLALPANAAEPLPAAADVSLPLAHGQSFAVAGGAAAPAIQQSTYGATGIATAAAAGDAGEDNLSTTGSQTNAGWAELVLQDGGWPVTANNVTVILQWMDSENSPQSWWLRNNPLNNGYGSGGGAGFGSYPNLVVAAQDVAVNLAQNAGYAAIVSAFTSSAPISTTVQAIEDSPWAGSHYGYGSLWHGVDVPIVVAPASDW